MGVVGGVIGHFWAHGFSLGKDDKFDIFVSLLAVMGVVFGGAGLGLYGWLQRSIGERFHRAAEDLRLGAQQGLDRTQFLIDSYFAANIWELATAGMAEEQRRTFYELALTLSTRAHRFAETRALGEASHWDREQVVRNMGTVVWLYAHFEREDLRTEGYLMAETIEQWLKETEGEDWELADNANYIRYKLPRVTEDRLNAQSNAAALLLRADVDEKMKASIRGYYNLV